ncbi:decaprenyl-phosphate phosphoribosyltransferase [candidate division KSB1 bacterium]|nr:decaprenyl-phosphate phosphoribosyltransferase [candidate division KSB1 bacterium]
MKTLLNIIKTSRPKQWIKNVLVFAGLVFSHDFLQMHKITEALFAFISFCLISSSVYIINDLFDREKDAFHPLKRNRPIASGQLSAAIALIAALFFAGGSILVAFSIRLEFALIIIVYLIINLAYSLKLKQIIIIDVISIASGFMLRIIGGTYAIAEPVSSWLIICAIFLTLFLALGKRRAELAALGTTAQDVRKTLNKYNQSYLNNLIIIVITGCLMSYALYTLDAETIAKFGNKNLIWTLPFVLYGLFRYLYLLEIQQQGEAPEETIFKDPPLLFSILLYSIIVIVIIYF